MITKYYVEGEVTHVAIPAASAAAILDVIDSSCHNKIRAIKTVRGVCSTFGHGCGLKEAKDVVEAVAEHYGRHFSM